METFRRWVPLITVICSCLFLQRLVALRLMAARPAQANPNLRRFIKATLIVTSLWLAAGLPILMEVHFRWMPADLVGFLLAASLFWICLIVSAAIWSGCLQHAETFHPDRRRFLALGAPVAAAPLAIAGYGAYLARTSMVQEQVDLHLPNLHPDLNGLRIVQLTDIHFGPFFGPAELRRAIGMANEYKPHLIFLTGDLVTRRGDNMEGCLQLLRGLKAEAGIYGCHGNHEIYAEALDYATTQGARYGFHFLRQRAALLRFGQARLNLAGFDYQPLHSPYLTGAESLIVPGAANLLLQHNPDTFPRAAQAGFDVTLSGHTHGGQINVEILHENLSAARFFTPFVRGLYERDRKLVYVSSGLGTVAMPVRLGVPPEVSLLRLCAT
ncbi:metallophosphoesterase [Paludibaculum fermentans]|uniref:Metallophosphoesterase n=1 Tax=Paludibaculum fermentans TaxID=1473598 RepID=A0A7S7NNZ5_PALFE|nr:metallophosphoesterase [Paludibaculum fermentans]QOY87138.1 metallophosphoesterase [Paludibaculum fermentans]